MELFSTTSGKTRRSCRTASRRCLTGGRVARLENLPEQARREAEGSGPSCGQLSVRLGEASEAVVWKCQLGTSWKENCERPPEQKTQLVRTSPQQTGVFQAARV